MLEHITDAILPIIISSLEIIGILIIAVGATRAFIKYICSYFKTSEREYEAILLHAMAVGLEFKMAAEILKTVLVQNLEELVVLGAVILLRGVMSVIIYYEMKHTSNHHGAGDIN